VGNCETHFELINFLRGYNLLRRHNFNFQYFGFVEDNIPNFVSERIQPHAKRRLWFSVIQVLEDSIPQFESERIQP
jgi:hypothetical protein